MADEHAFCITNDMGAVHKRDRPFPCRRRGMTSDGARIPEAHYASCENDGCRGCVPRSARFGMLCPVCWGRLQDALPRLAWLIAHLRSIEKPAQALGERVATSMERSILMPDSWIVADELLTAIGAPVLPSTASIDDAVALAHEAVEAWSRDMRSRVNTVEGATQAVILVKRMGLALKRWPDSEAELRHIPFVACPTCHKAHLWRRAPRQAGDDIRVECGTPDCGYSLDWWEWSTLYAPAFTAIEQDMKRREKAARKEAS